MKINFSKAALTDLDGNIKKNAEGEPLNADHKHLANKLFDVGVELFGVLHLDNVAICSKINNGEEIEVTELQVERLKEFINSLAGTKGPHAMAWLKLLEDVNTKKAPTKPKP